MENNIALEELFCDLCTHQFYKKSTYEMHQLVKHKFQKEPLYSADENISGNQAENGNISGNQTEKENISENQTEKEMISRNQTEDENIVGCYICLELFSNQSTLESHMITVHDGIVPHPCLFCDEKFSTKQKLSNHISLVHDDKYPHKCSICEYKCLKKIDCLGTLQQFMRAKNPSSVLFVTTNATKKQA